MLFRSPICLANLIVFFVVGVWHGAAWKYIVYGMYNGIIIAFSGLMAEHYRNWKKKFNITGKENWYHVFMIIRTFILVNISWFFDRAATVGQAFHMMKLSVTKFAPSQLLLIPAGKEGTALRVLFPKEMNVESGYFLEEPERIEQLKQELSRQSGRDVELEVSVMNTDNDDSDMINLDCIHMDVKIEEIGRASCRERVFRAV